MTNGVCHTNRNGAFYIWNLSDGHEVYRTATINRPVNIDVRYKIPFRGRYIDVAVGGVRGDNTLRVYRINQFSYELEEITKVGGIKTGFKNTYGMCLYKRPTDGALFAFVSDKSTGDIKQFQLVEEGYGDCSYIEGKFVRSFG